MSGVCFIDTETTSLDAETGEIWEVALIERRPRTESAAHAAGFHYVDVEHRWLLPVDLTHADPVSLEIGGFAARHPQGHEMSCFTGDVAGHEDHVLTPIESFVAQLMALTEGAHIVGAVISFDDERLRRLLRHKAGLESRWHYHTIDIEAMTVGFLLGHGILSPVQLPWKSTELSLAVGVDPTRYETHTALGDARHVRDLWDVMVHGA